MHILHAYGYYAAVKVLYCKLPLESTVNLMNGLSSKDKALLTN